jgi:hypothetical protein
VLGHRRTRRGVMGHSSSEKSAERFVMSGS